MAHSDGNDVRKAFRKTFRKPLNAEALRKVFRESLRKAFSQTDGGVPRITCSPVIPPLGRLKTD